MGDSKDNKISQELKEYISAAVETGVQRGIKNAVSEYDMKRRKSAKIRYDKRIRNTSLLLKNYNVFLEHCENAVYELAEDIQLNDEESNVIAIFDKIYDMEEDKTIIESILKSKTRTMIILRHITNAIEFYKFKATKSKDIELQRRVRVIQMLFLDKETKNYEEISNIEHISTKTVNRDRKKAISELAPLIFGIDGIDMT